MGKKRRNQKKTSQAIQSEPKRASKRWILASAGLVLLFVASLAGHRLFFYGSQKQALLNSLSKLNLRGMEPQVADKIQRLREVVRRNPNSAAAWGKLAMNLDVHDLAKESVPLYKKAASVDSSEFRWPYFCAIALSEMGSPEALEWFERARKLRPDYVPLLVNYADALFHFDRIDQAAEKYHEALTQDQKCSHAYFGLAQICFAKNDMQNSRANLQKALEANPSHGEAYNLLVSVCRRLEDADCAARASVIAKSMPEKTPLPDPVYAEFGAEGESSLWYRFRGREYMKKGLQDEAIHEFQTALKLRPDAQSHEDLAEALRSAGKLQEAAEQYQAAVGLHPTAMNYHGLALMYAKMGRYAEAEQLFRKAIERKPDFAEAYFNLAVVSAKTGRLQATIENLKEAIHISRDYSAAHYHLGLAYLAANDQAAALQEYKLLLELDQNLAARLRALIEQKKASNITTEKHGTQ